MVFYITPWQLANHLEAMYIDQIVPCCNCIHMLLLMMCTYTKRQSVNALLEPLIIIICSLIVEGIAILTTVYGKPVLVQGTTGTG